MNKSTSIDTKDSDYKIDRVNINLNYNLGKELIIAETIFDFEFSAPIINRTIILQTATISDSRDVYLNEVLLEEGQHYHIFGNSLQLFSLPEVGTLKIYTTSAIPFLIDLNTPIVISPTTIIHKDNFLTDLIYIPRGIKTINDCNIKFIANKNEYPTILSNINKIEQVDLPNNEFCATFKEKNIENIDKIYIAAGNFKEISRKLVQPSGNELTIRVWVEPNYTTHAADTLDSYAKILCSFANEYGHTFELKNDELNVIYVEYFPIGTLISESLHIHRIDILTRDKTKRTFEQLNQIECYLTYTIAHQYIEYSTKDTNLPSHRPIEGLAYAVANMSANQSNTHKACLINTHLGNTLRLDNGLFSIPVGLLEQNEITPLNFLLYHQKGIQLWEMIKDLIGAKAWVQSIVELCDANKYNLKNLEDFIGILEKNSEFELKDMLRWWNQKGSPIVEVKETYDEDSKTLSIVLTQKSKHLDNLPLTIPIHIRLYNSNGDLIPIIFSGDDEQHPTAILQFNENTQIFTFVNIESKPILGLSPAYLTPIALDYSYLKTDDVHILFKNEKDFIVKWNYLQSVYMLELMNSITILNKGASAEFSPIVSTVWGEILTDPSLNTNEKYALLSLPSQNHIFARSDVIHLDATKEAYRCINLLLCEDNKDHIISEIYKINNDLTDEYDENNHYTLKLILLLTNILNTYAKHVNDEDTLKEISALGINLINNYRCLSICEAGLSIVLSNKLRHTQEVVEIVKHFYANCLTNRNTEGVKSWMSACLKALPSLNTFEMLKTLSIYKDNEYDFALELNKSLAQSKLFNHKDGSGYDLLANEIIRLSASNANTAGLIIYYADANHIDVTRSNHMRASLLKITKQSTCAMVCSSAEKILSEQSQNEKVFIKQLDHLLSSSNTDDALKKIGSLAEYYIGDIEESLETFQRNVLNALESECTSFSIETKNKLNELVNTTPEFFKELFKFNNDCLTQQAHKTLVKFNLTQEIYHPRLEVTETFADARQVPDRMSIQYFKNRDNRAPILANQFARRSNLNPKQNTFAYRNGTVNRSSEFNQSSVQFLSPKAKQ